MADVTQELNRFIDVVKTSEIYHEYEKQKELLKRNPELKKQVDDYRQQNYEIQMNTASEQLFDRLDAFQKEYESFREIPVVRDFLAAELDYCRMIQGINQRFFEEFALDFE